MTASGDGALLGAAHWIEGMMVGPVATSLAVLAIAGTGLMMLNGRIPVRRGLTVALGCFVLFGAPTIARGLFASAASVAEPGSAGGPTAEAISAIPFPKSEPDKPQVSDPYAGASVAR